MYTLYLLLEQMSSEIDTFFQKKCK